MRRVAEGEPITPAAMGLGAGTHAGRGVQLVTQQELGQAMAGSLQIARGFITGRQAVGWTMAADQASQGVRGVGQLAERAHLPSGAVGHRHCIAVFMHIESKNGARLVDDRLLCV